METCTHISQINKDVKPNSNVCEECVKSGDTWVHLRMCLICGKVGCCNSSINKHARAHFHESNHPIITSFEPKADWLWCYIDDKYVEDESLNNKEEELKN